MTISHPDHHYRRMVQSVQGCALVSLDDHGRIDSWNPGAQRLHLHAADDILGADFSRLFTDADARVGNPGRVLGAARAQGSVAEDCWLVRADGSRFWADLLVTALGGPGRIDGFAVIIRDVTPRKQALDEALGQVQELSQASRLKSDFLAKMSHELRTPLTAMLGFSDVLLRGLDGELSPLQQEDVARIRRSGMAILELINDILDLSKIESGKMTLRLETVDAAQLAAATVNSLGKLAEDKGLYLVTDFAGTSLDVEADPLRVAQVLTNLVANAIKFTEQGGVTIHGTLEPTEVRIEVRDTGVGIAPEAVSMIWEEFRQGEAGARSQAGTGLGLAISRRLVHLHGGSIGVDSKPDGGSVFWFTLPRPTGAPPVERRTRRSGEAPERQPGLPEDRELILVVEDDGATRAVISRRLKAAGFRTIEASGGAQAISAARELRPALVTLDMVMPRVDGWTVLAALRDDPRTRDIPVVVASIIEDRELAIELGAAEYVPKPFPLDELTAAVERLLLPGAAARVLVVDDDAEIRELVRRSLAEAGMEVEAAGGGAEAMEMALSNRHDLVITDLLMPGMSGFELIIRLRADERTHDMPVVVFTGKDLLEGDHQVLNGQVLGLLEKSGIAPADLVSTVHQALRTRLP